MIDYRQWRNVKKNCQIRLDSSDNQDRDRENDKNECGKEGGSSDKHGN